MADETDRLPDLIRGLLLIHDPMWLFNEEYGNYDEYEMEVRALADRIAGVNTLEETLDLVWTVFVYWFTPSLAGYRSHYRPIADALWTYLARLRSLRLGEQVNLYEGFRLRALVRPRTEALVPGALFRSLDGHICEVTGPPDAKGDYPVITVWPTPFVQRSGRLAISEMLELVESLTNPTGFEQH